MNCKSIDWFLYDGKHWSLMGCFIIPLPYIESAYAFLDKVSHQIKIK